MNIPFLLGLLFSAAHLFAGDQTGTFDRHYQKSIVLTENDIRSLQNKEIVLIPGIVSESFYWEDDRSILDFAFIFRNYFEAQKKHYNNLKIPVTRLMGSSRSVEETIDQIEDKMKEIVSRKRKVYFIVHSLGGLALLDYLSAQSDEVRSYVEGIVFLQTPFYGSPIATVYFENPYYARTLLGPIMPFLNTSEETVRYLSVQERDKRMSELEPKLGEILKDTKVIMAAGKAFNSRSIFRPSLNVIHYGCVTLLSKKCLSRQIYNGPFGDSDGMVPFENALLQDYNYVELKNVDHGETILRMPFQDIDSVKMTDSLLKMIL